MSTYDACDSIVVRTSDRALFEPLQRAAEEKTQLSLFGAVWYVVGWTSGRDRPDEPFRYTARLSRLVTVEPAP